MEQTGYVTKVSDDRIKVRVIRESSCGGNCVSCKGCPSGIQLIECAAYDGASVGDRVILYADSKSVIGGAAVGYAVPAALAILGSVGGFALYSTDIASVTGAVLGIAFGLGLAKIISARRKILIKAKPFENKTSNK